ncbi:Fes/CIP4 domain-containing protein [Metarhizium robertsii ARSEF 23]|uniref:Fes/CIP4 domain-containing protein n=1 Tax=Metarhizium robertsii (strain ARSEF 23 / ATCC MYA-3075) TaxID=655844 RepID=E9F7E0_METRA|nr:Fes/CIP4 domain-containing protein [Metarhizium robertsii ARSEF 23]EFY96277.1 Fes/CIP4 domain-containing protein [Metarhizium robertsii ARSEF 23]
MEDMARSDYPAMLAHLQPGQAVQTLNDRVKRINKVNLEIADWLQARTEQNPEFTVRTRVRHHLCLLATTSDPVLSLSRIATPPKACFTTNLALFSVFQVPWTRIVDAIERIAQSHHVFAERLESDVEHPLRLYQQRRDYQNMHNISSNLTAMARDLEGAQDKSDKLNRKGAKASSQKVDEASAKLESAAQQWESQAPFIFESLQAVDETRVNHLRDVLTQYQTHETDQAQRVQEIAAQTLAVVLEINTEKEIKDFVAGTVAGKPLAATRTSTRRASIAGRQPSLEQPPPMPHSDTMNSTASATIPPPTRGSVSQQSHHDDDANEQLPTDQPKESKLRRLGTLFGGRRRQSVHGGFGSLSPGKGGGITFGRLGSSHGRGVSPRTSSTNLHESGRLASLAESPDTPTASTHEESINDRNRPHEATNGVHTKDGTEASGVNGARSTDVFDVPPPPGPPPTQQTEKTGGLTKDEEGFTVRAPMNDPISEAQREAAGEEADQLFKLNIQNKPVEEEDPEAKQAALSSVANTLKLGPATRRTSTIRGRRDVRNTVFVPPPGGTQTEPFLSTISASPPMPSSASFMRSPAMNALASETSTAGTSDSQSVRSGHSLGSLAHAKHPELTGPGLQSSIIETVSATFEDGVVKSANIAGELAFVNNDADISSEKTHETIRINNFPKLERIGPNRIFVQNASPDQPDQYALDLSHLAKTSIAFSYKVFSDDSDPSGLGKHCPLLLKPVWKPQEDKLGLLLQYQLNPMSTLTAPITLHNAVFVARYEGKAISAQTKPSGTHLKDKHLVYWRLGDVTLTSDMQKIVCRIVGAEGICPSPGHVEARWEYTASGDALVGSGISVSRLADKGKGKELTDDDPFADAGSATSQTWLDIPVIRKLVSGKYEGK